MKKVGFASVSIFFMLLLCGCLETQLTTSYVNEKYGIGINPPEGWILQDNTSGKWIVTWFPSDNSSTSFSIAPPYRLDEGLALSVFADDIEENYPESYVNYSMLNRDWLTIGGLTAHEIVYSYARNGSFFRERQVAVKHIRDVYIIKYGSPLGEYDEFFTFVNKSTATFQVK